MSTTVEQIKDYLNQQDRFCKFNQMQITVLRPGYAEAEMIVTEHSLNGLNIVQGGAMYTLSDLAFAGAVNAYGTQAIGMNSSTSFIRPGTGKIIKAVATEVSRGKKTGVYNVDVFDEKGKLLCRSTITAFLTGQEFVLPKP